MNPMEIPTSQLFKDLQESLTEIVLVELIDEIDPSQTARFYSRVGGNIQIRDAIRSIMLERFSIDDIVSFLENGYPREVNLSNRIG